MLTHTRGWSLVHDEAGPAVPHVAPAVCRAAPRRALFHWAIAGAMVTLADYAMSKPCSRARLVGDDEYETHDAGQSDGQSAGDIVVGFGGMVRRLHLHSPSVQNLAEQCVLHAVQANRQPRQTPGSRLHAGRHARVCPGAGHVLLLAPDYDVVGRDERS